MLFESRSPDGVRSIPNLTSKKMHFTCALKEKERGNRMRTEKELLEDGVKQGIDAREGASTRSNAAVGVTGVGV